MYDHQIGYGFFKGYIIWINHGEWDINFNIDDHIDWSRDDIDELLNDQFRDVAHDKCIYEIQMKMPRNSIT